MNPGKRRDGAKPQAVNDNGGPASSNPLCKKTTVKITPMRLLAGVDYFWVLVYSIGSLRFGIF